MNEPTPAAMRAAYAIEKNSATLTDTNSKAQMIDAYTGLPELIYACRRVLARYKQVGWGLSDSSVELLHKALDKCGAHDLTTEEGAEG